jgi:hypothetical protein
MVFDKVIEGSSRHVRNVAETWENPENLQGIEIWTNTVFYFAWADNHINVACERPSKRQPNM